MNIGDSKAMHYKSFSDESILPEIDSLSVDHKPENPEEKSRIENAGFKVEMDRGCFRICKNLANSSINISRTIGDLMYKKNSSLSAEN